MIVLEWGAQEDIITLQWAGIASDTVIAERRNGPDPVAVVVATGTGDPEWTTRQW